MLIALLFSLLIVFVNIVWLSATMGWSLPFFSYEFQVTPSSVYQLASAQLTLTTGFYAGYLLARGVRAGKEYQTMMTPCHTDDLWLVSYAIGLTALVVLVMVSGGFSEVFSNLGAKYERQAGRGELVLLHYFAYVGILLWFRKNIGKPVWWRLRQPHWPHDSSSASGSRTDMLITVLAAAYMDESSGRKIRFRRLAAACLAGVLFFAFYQMLRSNFSETDLLFSIYKDLSMGIGYLIAVDDGIYGKSVNLGVYMLSFVPVLPRSVKDFLGFPESPNTVFTHHVFPDSMATFATGIWGEAAYILPYLCILHYIFIGVLLTLADRRLRGVSTVTAAIVVGSAVRVGKDGITQALANTMMFLAPLLAIYLLSVFLTTSLRKNKVLS